MGRTLKSLVITLLFSQLCTIYGELGSHTVHDDTNGCKPDKDQAVFEALPGQGWDNLQNRELGQVVALTYSTCQTSEDRRFLLADGVSLTATKKSTLDLDSELVDHFSNYTSLTARSVNLETSALGMPSFQISGSFSWEKEKIKKQQTSSKSSISRVQFRSHMYTSHLQPDAPLHSVFRNRILDLASHLTVNNTLTAAYLADMIVHDYGTHFINSMSAGAILAKVDLLTSSYMEKLRGNRQEIGASASASFFSKLNLSARFHNSVNSSQINHYERNCVHSEIRCIGGPIYTPEFSVDKWSNDLFNNLVAIDRAGEPLYYALTPRTLPDLPPGLAYDIGIIIKEAIGRYYIANTVRGCMDVNSANFNNEANIDNGNCLPPKTNFSLGGTFQNCSGPPDFCTQIEQSNPATGKFSCPSGFSPILLEQAVYRCRKECHTYSLLTPNHCHTVCSNFSTYWCAPLLNLSQKDRHPGFIFGGLFSEGSPNPVTQNMDCPVSYLSVKLGSSITICLGDDIELGGQHRLPFGGFYSCISQNPLSTTGSQCPEGYRQHLAGIDFGCHIGFCVQTDVMVERRGLRLRRPPFISIHRLRPNWTAAVAAARRINGGPNGQDWGKGSSGNWQLFKSSDSAFSPSLGKQNSSDSDDSSDKRNYNNMLYRAVLIAVFTTVGISACIGLVIILILKRKWRLGNSGYRQL